MKPAITSQHNQVFLAADCRNVIRIAERNLEVIHKDMGCPIKQLAYCRMTACPSQQKHLDTWCPLALLHAVKTGLWKQVSRSCSWVVGNDMVL